LEKNHEEFQMYSQYNTNAETRYKAIQSLIKEGDKRAIDSVEELVSEVVSCLENSKLKLLKAKLELSNFYG
jgi:HEAT repeat protein